MEQQRTKRNNPKTSSNLRRSYSSEMNPEGRAKRPKLEANEKKEKPRIPDDVLFKIFSLLSIRDRMRLSLVSKRFRQLVHFDPKRTVWKEKDGTLSLTLEGVKNDRVTRINGQKFAPERRTKAVQLLFDYCAPFKRVEILVWTANVDDLPWLKNIFVRYLMEAQTAAGKGAPPELSFRGNLRYAPAVFEIADEHTAKIDIEIGSRQPKAAAWRMEKLEEVWSKISTCTGLTEFHFGCNANFLLDTEQALAALSGKESLHRLSFKMSGFRDPHLIPPFLETVAAIANSCPSLLTLVCGAQDWSDTEFIDLMEPATRQRLQELTIWGEQEPEMDGGMWDVLANRFTALTKLSVHLDSAAPFIETFLAEHQLEDRIVFVDLDLSFGTGLYGNQHTSALIEELKWVCDGFAMAPDGRFAFVKGFVVVACKYVQEKWPDEDLITC